jgi:hypothetical protein
MKFNGKKYLTLIITCLVAITINAQKVFSVDSQWQADVKVYVVDSEWQADLSVFKVSSQWQADGNEGKWYFTDSQWQADKKIYFIKG